MEALKEYSWPGNVRELKNLIERLVILTSASTIDVADLPMMAPEEGGEGRYFDLESYVAFKDAVEKDYFERKTSALRPQREQDRPQARDAAQ